MADQSRNDFSDNENGLGAQPNDSPQGNDSPKKAPEKPVQPNTDVEGGNGDVSTT